MLAGDNIAFKFHPVVGTQLASWIDRRTGNSDILVNEIMNAYFKNHSMLQKHYRKHFKYMIEKWMSGWKRAISGWDNIQMISRKLQFVIQLPNYVPFMSRLEAI